MCYLTAQAIKEMPSLALYALAFSGWNNGRFTSEDLASELELRGAFAIDRSMVEDRIRSWADEGLLNRSTEGQDVYEIAC